MPTAYPTPAINQTLFVVRRAPAQLRQGLLSFLALSEAHPDLHPAVIGAVLASPASDRQSLLDAARQCLGQGDSGNLEAQPTNSQLSLSSDSDEAWEDAVEDLDFLRKQTRASSNMASVVTDSEVVRLEREAEEWRVRWQQTRQLSFWTRYKECRSRLVDFKTRSGTAGTAGAGRQQLLSSNSRLSDLERQRQEHERRLLELKQRRERLRWSKHYEEQTRIHHSKLAETQLQDQLRKLEETAQVRRLQHQRRVQELIEELAVDEQDKPQSVEPKMAKLDESRSEFTHAWDDFCHWEKMVSDEKEVLVVPNPPDLIPFMQPQTQMIEQALQKSESWGDDKHFVNRHDEDSGFDERKKWFEEALLAWHAPDEDFGTSLYSPPEPTWKPTPASKPAAPHWFESAWNAWQGPAVLIR